MSAMHVLLSDEVRAFVDEQIKSGRYESPSAMISALLEEARLREARERLNTLLEEGENSGPPVEFTEEWWEARKASLLARLPNSPSA
ncbi:MAG TPA: type II toxin-antitoxin system ParD family antitoxin [Pirellulaceae bacterium]|nr:type II toxin-antitoxin system ParD family antitoxin [Pirellulaceae bacterium]